MNLKIKICILLESEFKIEKNYFTQGFPPKIYEIIMSIQATYFLSHKIRKYTDLYLIFMNEQFVIHYEGNNLRYLGPDERSIGMLLLKVLGKKDLLNRRTKVQSTPGLWIQKKTLRELFLEFGSNTQIIIVDGDSTNSFEASTTDTLVLLISRLKNGYSDIKTHLTNQPFYTLGVKNLPQKMRTYLSILKFYSIFDKLQGRKNSS